MAVTGWRCQTCTRAGEVAVADNAGVYEVAYAIEDAHTAAHVAAAAAFPCVFDLAKVRVWEIELVPSHDRAAVRDAAVQIVDGRHGYSYEFDGSPAAHLEEYDVEEERLQAIVVSVLGGRL